MADLRYCGNCGLSLRNLTPAQQNTLESGLCPRCGAAISITGDVLSPGTGQWPAQREESARGGSSGPFDLAMVHAAVRAPHEQASRTRINGNIQEAGLIDATVIQVMCPLVKAIGGDSGWLRAVRLLFDTSVPTLIDALQSPSWPLACVRLSALLVVPNVAQLTSLADIAEAIRSAIRAGVPIYNAGDPRSCATTYWTTALTLAKAPRASGILGVSRALRPLEQALATSLPRIGDDAHAIEDFAWWMRHSLDAALAVTQE